MGRTTPKPPQLVILMGPQASGKSAFYLANFFSTHIRINLDMLRTRHRENLIFHACLTGKQSVVIDNTNPTRLERARYIEPAKSHGFFITGYYFRTSLEECLQRNRTRASGLVIPEHAIRSVWRKMEKPELTDGFDDLYEVETYQGNFIMVA